jgi:hypothetical protein
VVVIGTATIAGVLANVSAQSLRLVVDDDGVRVAHDPVTPGRKAVAPVPVFATRVDVALVEGKVSSQTYGRSKVVRRCKRH